MEDCPDNTKNALIFQHIPKTAGSTLHALFNKRYDSRNTYNVFASSHTDEEVDKLRNLELSERCKIDILKGHMPFGLHKYLPKPSQYFTILRDPVKRVISSYFYIRKNPENPLSETIINNNWSVGDYVSSGVSVGANNGQVRWLLGNLKDVPFNEIGIEHLNQVKKNIDDHFLLVGINEMFDHSLLVLSHKLGWGKKPYYDRMNTNKKKASVAEDDIEIIKQYNQLDIELYNYCVNLLEREINNIPGFYDTLESYQEANRLRARIRAPFRFLRLLE